MSTRRRASALVAAAALAVAGCGGSDKDQIKAAITDYYTAFANADGAKACSKLSSKTRTTLERSASGKKCADAVAQAAKQPTFARVRSKVKDAKVQSVKVSGNTASASVSLLNTTVPISVVKEGGNWKIQSSAASGG